MHYTYQHVRDLMQPPPEHVAIIMDGNGRWAEKRNLPRAAGHKKGAESVRAVVKSCKKNGVKYLTLYTFSTENWKRPKSEVDGLMVMIASTLKTELEELHKNDVCIKVIGDWAKLPHKNQEILSEAIEKTKDNQSLYLILALSYSGRDEIVRMAQKLTQLAQVGELDPKSINEEMISYSLDTSGVPDPDLLIRTGGDMRVSNFLLWQIAYSELYLTDKFWPDFQMEDFEAALSSFQNRERKFGELKPTQSTQESNHMSA